jgi:hypothetical protein
MVWSLQDINAMRTKVGRRKLRLFGCGCCRSFWSRLRDARLRRAIECAEQCADGEDSKGELESHRATVEQIEARGEKAEAAQAMILGLLHSAPLSTSPGMRRMFHAPHLPV